MGIFRKSLCFLDISSSGFRDLARGLKNIFHYLHKNNIFSFNFTLFSGLREKDYFWNYCRLIPRVPIPPMDTSDLNNIALLHDESISIITPEDVCREMKVFF
jgi:hypothetical protein